MSIWTTLAAGLVGQRPRVLGTMKPSFRRYRPGQVYGNLPGFKRERLPTLVSAAYDPSLPVLVMAQRKGFALGRILPSGPKVEGSVVDVQVRRWDGRRFKDTTDYAAAANARSVLWVDMSLDLVEAHERHGNVGAVGLWLQTWESPDKRISTDWSDVEGVAAGLGIELPDVERARGRIASSRSLWLPHIKRVRGQIATTVLQWLPYLNERGMVQCLHAQLPRDSGVVALPLVGFVPTQALSADFKGVDKDPATTQPMTQAADDDNKDEKDDNDDEALEFLLLRVNVAVVGEIKHIYTLRLPDRLCTGRREAGLENRRIGPPPRLPRPNLTEVVEAGLTRVGARATAESLGTQIAVSLAATCSCVPEYARARIFDLDQKQHRLPRGGAGDLPKKEHLAKLSGHVLNVYQSRGALRDAEEELLRLLERLSDRPHLPPKSGKRIVRRYRGGLEEIRTVDAALRDMRDYLSNRLATWQIHLAEDQRAATDRHERRVQALLAVVGTVLLIPALVATLFQEHDKLPDPDRWGGFGGMVLVMAGFGVLGGLGYQLLKTRHSAGESDSPASARRGPDSPGSRMRELISSASEWRARERRLVWAAAFVVALILIGFGPWFVHPRGESDAQSPGSSAPTLQIQNGR